MGVIHTPSRAYTLTFESTTLHDTFGLFGEIAEIFLFTPQPEGFVIFHGHIEIPNIDVIVSSQHNLIQIQNPNYSSLPIWSAVAPHFPTRRPALGTPVTLPGLGYEPYVATVVAIKQNQWPTEWAYMVLIEKKGRPPQLIITILDRESLNIQETSICISPKVIVLNNGKTAFFFDELD